MQIRSYIDLSESGFKFCLFEGFDPPHTTRHLASFLFQNGVFVPVAYQQHKATIADLAGIDMQGFRSWPFDRQETAHDTVNAYAVSNGIVQGMVQPGERSISGYLALTGTRPDMLKALRGFRTTYADVYVMVERFSLTEIGPDGRQTDAGSFQGKTSERKTLGWLRG